MRGALSPRLDGRGVAEAFVSTGIGAFGQTCGQMAKNVSVPFNAKFLLDQLCYLFRDRVRALCKPVMVWKQRGAAAPREERAEPVKIFVEQGYPAYGNLVVQRNGVLHALARD